MKFKMLKAAFAGFVLTVSGFANAGIIYATDGNGGSSSSNLYSIDSITGNVTLIGDIGYVVNGLTWDNTTNTLWAGSRSGSSYNGLLKLNTSTGLASIVGANYWGADSTFAPVHNITTNSSGAMYGWNENGDNLVSIDTLTGIATSLVGSLSTAKVGMSFDSNDELWLRNVNGNSTYKINTLTGTPTNVGAAISSGYTHGDIDLSTDLFWQVKGSQIDKFNLNTGLIEGSLVINQAGLRNLTFVNSTAVPEPSTLAIFALGMIGLASRRFKKQS